ncbi:hypothetical protein SteCoe_28645 [Stentor coeruleus]|uniref:Protein kinase domain-containing protein n=1 Tax=Stentor coeruleus TaxID=5963 RepID=A0A1R2B7S8_9CILI|nr:hypothetical protein SteCoe_28645 [Stentor coeruleus]
MTNGELFDYIVARNRLNESVAANFYHQILNATEYIHQLKIVHRDLKPENLLLDDKFNLKLADFGLSNTYVTGQDLDTPCGSPCYAAPEMVSGKSYNGLSVDIWSSGIVLYAMICGFLPFEDSNTASLYQRIIKGHYEVPEWLSNDAKTLLSHVLDTNPETRYSIDQIRSHPWMKNTIPKVLKEPDIDFNVIESIEKFGFKVSKVLSDIENNIKNSLTTLYCLLCKKKKIPRPPSALNSQRIRSLHGIKQEIRKDSIPASRIKIIAKSISPKAASENRSQSRTNARIRKYIMPKEPEGKPKTPLKKNGRAYKPTTGLAHFDRSFMYTPKNLELSYRVRPPANLFSP